jgi:virginiamycin B lyase
MRTAAFGVFLVAGAAAIGCQGVLGLPSNELYCPDAGACGAASAPAMTVTVTGLPFVAAQGATISGPIASAKDADASDLPSALAAVVDWGDGTPPVGVAVDGGSGAFHIQGAHTYAISGAVTVTVSVTHLPTGTASVARFGATVRPAPAVREVAVTPGSSPYFLAVAGDGNIWFTERLGNKVGRLSIATGAVDEYPGTAPDSVPLGIVAAPDGTIWVSEEVANTIVHFALDGTVLGTIPVPGQKPYPTVLAFDPSGDMWFTEINAGRIGHVAPGEPIDDAPTPSPSSSPAFIAPGADGAMWFTEFEFNRIGRAAVGAAVIEYPILESSSPTTFQGIAVGSDGALWVAEQEPSKIARVAFPGPTVMEYPTPTNASGPYDVTLGPDGNIWFTEGDAGRIGRITASGLITEFPLDNPGDGPIGIVAGSDGALWFTEQHADKIGSLTP